jgi:hypothetical protein
VVRESKPDTPQFSGKSAAEKFRRAFLEADGNRDGSGTFSGLAPPRARRRNFRVAKIPASSAAGTITVSERHCF